MDQREPVTDDVIEHIQPAQKEVAEGKPDTLPLTIRQSRREYGPDTCGRVDR